MLILEISKRRYSYLPVRPLSTSGTVHTSLQQQLTGHTQKTFASLSKNTVEKRKTKAIAKRYALTHTHNKVLEAKTVFRLSH